MRIIAEKAAKKLLHDAFDGRSSVEDPSVGVVGLTVVVLPVVVSILVGVGGFTVVEDVCIGGIVSYPGPTHAWR
jgi:hypothetical protein